MNMDQFTHEVELAIISINERIERATGQDYNELDAILETELLFSAVVSVEDQLPMGGGEIIIGAIQRVLNSIQELKDACQRRHVRGRPQISIKEDQLEFLLELHFPLPIWPVFFCVSTPTIHRRIVQYGLDEMTSCSDLADGALDEIIRLFVRTHPNSGGRSLAGFLREMGLKI